MRETVFEQAVGALAWFFAGATALSLLWVCHGVCLKSAIESNRPAWMGYLKVACASVFVGGAFAFFNHDNRPIFHGVLAFAFVFTAGMAGAADGFAKRPPL